MSVPTEAALTFTITPLPRCAAELLARLQAQCFSEEPWGPDALARILELCGVMGFLAWWADTPVGFVVARDLGNECEILSLGVLAEYRRRGIGRGLLRALAEETARRGLVSIVLEVASDNMAGRGLYACGGFVAVGSRPHYYRRGAATIDALILRCSVRTRPGAI